MSDKDSVSMNCNDAQLIMAVYLANDPSVTAEERQAFEVHLSQCTACAREYGESKLVVSLIKKYACLSEDTCRLLEQKGYTPTLGKQTTAERQGTENPTPVVHPISAGVARSDYRDSRRRAWRISALAASIILVMAVGWQMRSLPRTSAVPSRARTSVGHPVAELVLGTQRKPLLFGQPVATVQNKQEILLGRMHRVVMNSGTSMTIRADEWKGKTRYNLELAKGELYVEVVPGNPFTVQTPNANLIITGTRFDVRTSLDQTEVLLVKGSVRFGNHYNKWTPVSAGQASRVFRNDAPEYPRLVEVAAATAWARDLALANVLARADAGSVPIEDPGILVINTVDSSHPGLETLDYESWVAGQRDWFKKEFPWIFRIEKDLAARGIQTDYVTLLMISGEITQFHYPCSWNQPLAQYDPHHVVRIAQWYGLRTDDVMASINEYASNVVKLPDRTSSSQEALRAWRSELSAVLKEKHELPDDLALFTLRAASFLTRTRTAAYLWAKANPDLASRLLGDKAGRQVLEGFEVHYSGDLHVWLEAMQKLVVSTRTMGSLIQELLLTRPTADCQSQAGELVRQLQNEVSMRECGDHPTR